MSHKRSRRSRMNKHHGRDGFNVRLFLTIAVCALFALAAAGLVIFVIFPTLSETLGFVTPSPTPAPPSPTPTPTPTPAPLDNLDFASLTRQPQFNEKFAGYPVFMDSKLLYASYSSDDDNTKFDKLFLFDPDQNAYVDFPSPELQNDSFANIVCNEKWIAYLDHKDSGGGQIMAMAKTDLKPTAIKTYYSGMPRLSVLNDMLVWTERTGSRMDKLFACDLATLENVTLYTFSNSYYGTSASYAFGDQVIWADYDPDQSASEVKENPKSSIFTLKLGAPRPESYKPGVYVHDPVANSEAVAWVDGNHSPDQKLYLRIGQDEPTVIAEGVTAYAFGKTFLSYCQNEMIYIYPLREKRAYPVTAEGTKAIMAGVSENRILWYDITDSEAQGTKDLLKFVRIPE